MNPELSSRLVDKCVLFHHISDGVLPLVATKSPKVYFYKPMPAAVLPPAATSKTQMQPYDTLEGLG